jgi:hypothetical protein
VNEGRLARHELEAAPKMTHASAQRNLILGLAEGLDWEQLRPFVESLGHTSFAGELHLFIAGTDEATLAALRTQGVVLHPYRRIRFERNGRVFHPYDPPLQRFRSSRITPLYPRVIRGLAGFSPDRLGARARLAAPISIPYVARYFRYYTFLTSSGARYDNVMVTDVRDVFFQRDPFDFEIGEEVHCFLEDERQTLATERFDRNWLLIAYGEETLRELGDKPISCSGITIAPRNAMLNYLRVMTAELLRLRRQIAGIDQGVHNYAIHRGLVPRARLVRNGDGPVFTVALVPQEETDAAIDQGRLDANVVHQYQHHARLKETLLQRLA